MRPSPPLPRRRDALPPLSRAGVAPPSISLRLIKGKHSRPDQSYVPIQAALQQMAAAFSAPLAVLPDEQVGGGLGEGG